MTKSFTSNNSLGLFIFDKLNKLCSMCRCSLHLKSQDEFTKYKGIKQCLKYSYLVIHYCDILHSMYLNSELKC